jgi:hypothetical protein
MALRNLKVREIVLIVIACAIAVLLIMSGSRFYARVYREAILFLVLAGALALVFFRKRKIALAIISLSWVLVNAGLTAPFHPSFLGYALTIGSAGALYLIVRWSHKTYPYLSRRNIRFLLFEGEAAMAAENTRIEAETRELAKKRPYGPWLFR